VWLRRQRRGLPLIGLASAAVCGRRGVLAAVAVEGVVVEDGVEAALVGLASAAVGAAAGFGRRRR
jgi:hypothetical protein